MDAQAVALDAEADAFGSGFLPPLQLVVAELEDRTAPHTDHVVVMLVAQHVLEAAATIPGVQPFDEAGVLQHHQGPVDRRARDPAILPLAQRQQLIGGEVVVAAQRGLHDQGPLLGPAAAATAQLGFDDAQFLVGLHGGLGRWMVGQCFKPMSVR